MNRFSPILRPSRRPGRPAARRLGILALLLCLSGGSWLALRQTSLSDRHLSIQPTATLLQIAARQPDNQPQLLKIADVLLAHGEPHAVLNLLAPSMERENALPVSSRAPLEGIWSEALILSGQVSRGRQYFQKALSLDSNCVPAIRAEASWLESQSAWSWADQVYSIVLNHEPTDAFSWLHLGMVRRHEENFGPAHTALQRALALMPGDSRVLRALADVEMDEGAFEAAARDYRLALHSDPRNGAARVGMALAAAEEARTPADMASARAALLANLTTHPAQIRSALGMLELRFGDASRARADLEEAARREDAQPRVYYGLAQADRMLGLTTRAAAAQASFRSMEESRTTVAMLQKRIAAHPESAGLHRQLAAQFEQDHRLSEAVAEYQWVLRLRPGDPEATAHLRSLSPPLNSTEQSSPVPTPARG